MRKLLPTGGLAFKTFAFALILMTAVMIMTLGILYVFLPNYYFTHMTNQLNRSADILIQEISNNADTQDVLPHIIDFSATNNVIIMAFGESNELLLDYSSFFPSVYQPILSRHIIQGEHMGLSDNIMGIQIVDSNVSDVPFDIEVVPRLIRLEPWTFVPASEFEAAHVTIAAYAGGNFVVSGDRHRNVWFSRAVNHPDIEYLTFSGTLQPIDQAQAVILAMIPYLAVAGFAIALIIAFIFSRHLTKPIIKIADAAAQMRQMIPGVVSGVGSKDEVGRLSHTLDKLYQDLCANIQDLQTEMEKTAQLERSKTDLMRAAGHELKTPIAALSGMLDGMIDKVGAYKNHEKYLPELKSQTERLSRLVNEILIASQADNADNSIEIAPVDINALIDETAEQYLPLVEKKGLCLNITPNEGFSYDTDRQVLFIALSNLLSNAVKYTPEGGEIRICTAINHDGKVLFIENQCDAIDTALMPKWFEPFYTPDYSRDKSKGGTGLGLYIVKKNLNMLGLPFEIAALDDGVRFEIYFP